MEKTRRHYKTHYSFPYSRPTNKEWHVVFWQFHMQTIFLKYSFYLILSQRFLELPPELYSEPVMSSENMQVILCHQVLNLRIFFVNLVNSVVVFWVNRWQNMFIWPSDKEQPSMQWRFDLMNPHLHSYQLRLLQWCAK